MSFATQILKRLSIQLVAMAYNIFGIKMHPVRGHEASQESDWRNVSKVVFSPFITVVTVVMGNQIEAAWWPIGCGVLLTWLITLWTPARVHYHPHFRYHRVRSGIDRLRNYALWVREYKTTLGCMASYLLGVLKFSQEFESPFWVFLKVIAVLSLTQALLYAWLIKQPVPISPEMGAPTFFPKKDGVADAPFLQSTATAATPKKRPTSLDLT